MVHNLEIAITEKDVENLWRAKIQTLFPESTIASPYNSDGYLETPDGKISLLHKEGIYEKLSPDAKEVLDMATELVKKSFDMRKALHEEHPEYHLNTWDAGWYQIKLIIKQFYQEDAKIFAKKYKEFEDRMRPLVYELGFLRK